MDGSLGAKCLFKLQTADWDMADRRPVFLHLTQNAYWTQGPTTSKSYWTFKWLLDQNDTNTQAKRETKVPEGRGALV